jgi:hypothetical protein
MYCHILLKAQEGKYKNRGIRPSLNLKSETKSYKYYKYYKY